ncbi:hypothetical protein SODG_007579 [Sodalis praecaptivus]
MNRRKGLHVVTDGSKNLKFKEFAFTSIRSADMTYNNLFAPLPNLCYAMIELA